MPTYSPTISSVATPKFSTINGKKGQMTFIVNPSTTFIMPNTVSTRREMPPSEVQAGEDGIASQKAAVDLAKTFNLRAPTLSPDCDTLHFVAHYIAANNLCSEVWSLLRCHASALAVTHGQPESMTKLPSPWNSLWTASIIAGIQELSLHCALDKQSGGARSMAVSE